MYKISFAFISLLLVVFCLILYSKDMQVAGVIDSVRKDGFITIICDSELAVTEYQVYNDGKLLLGTIKSPEKIGITGSNFRYMALFTAADNSLASLLRPGLQIVIVNPDRAFDKALVPEQFQHKTEYRERIISRVDGREMALVAEGKFFLGSSYGDSDESPEQQVYLPDYYIDIYEVSNADYKAFTDSTGTKIPADWKGKVSRDGAFTDTYYGSLPVIVSYHEAVKYARWTGKRLPDEKEWEKAARFPAVIDKPGQLSVYTWGYSFRDGISNTSEFWIDENTGENLKLTVKQRYNLQSLIKGYIPVNVYEPAAVSYYGCVHMDGNAQEWTESWYRAYENNYAKDKKFGTQYKVIRGGAWFTTRKEARVTDRKIGGIPDLYTDRIAGFRCVRNTAPGDRK